MINWTPYFEGNKENLVSSNIYLDYFRQLKEKSSIPGWEIHKFLALEGSLEVTGPMYLTILNILSDLTRKCVCSLGQSTWVVKSSESPTAETMLSLGNCDG